MMKIVVASGYFSPLHVGHIRYLRAARELGKFLVVIVNNNLQAAIKGCGQYMPACERVEVVAALSCVDDVVMSDDSDRSVNVTLRRIRGRFPATAEKMVFANGGDVSNEADCLEAAVCRELGIEMIFGVGGGKVRSSRYIRKPITFNV